MEWSFKRLLELIWTLVYVFHRSMKQFHAVASFAKPVNKITLLEVLFVYVIAWAQGQLRINFKRIFKVFTKLPLSRSDEGTMENFENTSEINP